MKLTLTLFLTIACSLSTANVCDGQDEVLSEYESTAQKIIAAARQDNDAYLKLQELCDDIGNRLSGSKSLEKAIEWAQQSMQNDGQENVRAGGHDSKMGSRERELRTGRTASAQD